MGAGSDWLDNAFNHSIIKTYCNLSSAGPAFKTSLTAIDGSPLAKCGLSRPPETAMPKPKPGTRDNVTV